ncbi:hypothetical protein [Neptuniibacter sp.]|uniref:hypothetical protein n=1 Tax=Neptuniibacter sp. TaxID=1962643 RepID=UPI0026278FFA|nr:hypothetical protein [Neptuniibacter sp.]MCP4597139.1 hypothetical protein [Neptuniibacter sp.]
MEELTFSNASTFLQRFQSFHDALVREARMQFMTKHSLTRAEVTLSVQDTGKKSNESWVNLTFKIDNVASFKLLEGPKTTCVVITELKIGFFEDKIYLDFSPYTEKPEGVGDFEKSDFLIAGERCVWVMSPYTEGL